eukprot:scaffold137536_cov19-Prasinocladus_malaysianus.AAC.1
MPSLAITVVSAPHLATATTTAQTQQLFAAGFARSATLGIYGPYGVSPTTFRSSRDTGIA